MKRTKLTPDDQKLILELYDSGQRQVDIMKKTGFARGTVQHFLRRSNKITKKRYSIKTSQLKKMVEMFNEGYTHQQIADALNVSKHCIRYNFQRNDLYKYGKRNPFRLKEEDIDEIKKLFKARYTDERIAKFFKISLNKLKKIKTSFNLNLKTSKKRGRFMTFNPSIELSQKYGSRSATEDQIIHTSVRIAELTRQGLKQNDIAKEVGCTRQTVGKHQKRLGLTGFRKKYFS